MTLETPQQVEEKLEELLSSVLENQGLIDFLKVCGDHKERGERLETHMINHLGDYALEGVDWGLGYEDSEPGDMVPMGFLRDRFFYEIQQRTEMDFGFCPHFIPAYKERTKYFLEGEKGDIEKNWDKCDQAGEPVIVACSGTGRDACAHLQSKE